MDIINLNKKVKEQQIEIANLRAQIKFQEIKLNQFKEIKSMLSFRKI